MITDIVMQDRKEPINLLELLTYTTAQVSPKQGNCSMSLSVEDPDLEVAGNRVRLARALANVLENALQAMSHTGGQIDISVKSLPDHRVRIVIADNGPGIAEEDKSKIFGLGFSTRGTQGLGLPYAAEVIRDHGGTINLWSVLGVGTKVVIYLPEVIKN
jgi:signal transduction histidine kinase